MLEARGDLPVNSGYEGIVDVGQEDACSCQDCTTTTEGHIEGLANVPKSAVAMASFPRARDFGASWASWPPGARMGLVSSADMAPQLRSNINPDRRMKNESKSVA